MPTTKEVVDSLHAAIASDVYSHKWRSDEDFARVVEAYLLTELTYSTLNSAVGRYYKETPIESPDPIVNSTGLIRALRKIINDNGVERRAWFYYLRSKNSNNDKLTVDIPTTTSEFQSIYDTVTRHSLSKRGNRDASSRNAISNKRCRQEVDSTTKDEMTDDETSKNETSENRTAVNETTTNETTANETTTNETTATANETITDRGGVNNIVSWQHGKAKALFGIFEGDVRSQVEAHADLLKLSTGRKKGLSIHSILTKPYDGAPTLSPKKAQEIHLKATYLHLAYCIALDDFEVIDGLPFMQCCYQCLPLRHVEVPE